LNFCPPANERNTPQGDQAAVFPSLVHTTRPMSYSSSYYKLKLIYVLRRANMKHHLL
jgi:hypothetical protein